MRALVLAALLAATPAVRSLPQRLQETLQAFAHHQADVHFAFRRFWLRIRHAYALPDLNQRTSCVSCQAADFLERNDRFSEELVIRPLSDGRLLAHLEFQQASFPYCICAKTRT